MKTLSVISLSILLAACGGSSSSSNEQSKAPVKPPVIAVVGGYDLALDKCGNNLVVAFDDLSINDSSENIKAQPNDDSASVHVSGSSHDICIDGNISELSLSGSSHDVYINGSVGRVNIESGSSMDLYIFGGITELNMVGSSHDVYTQEVAVINDSSSSSSIMNISNAEL